MFGISGEKLTNRLRNLLFSSVIRQDIGFFDDENNGTGILTTKLSSDAAMIKGMTGERIGISLSLVTTITVGLLIALVSCWRMALVIAACLPLMAVGAGMQLKILVSFFPLLLLSPLFSFASFLLSFAFCLSFAPRSSTTIHSLQTGFNQKAKKSYEASGQLASEAIMNIRTVAGLGIEDKFISSYQTSLAGPDHEARRAALVAGLSFGFGEATQFLVWALAFYYAAILATDGVCTFDDTLKAIAAVIFGGASIGQLSSLMPDFGKAKAAAASLYAIVDRVPPIDSTSQEGTRPQGVSGVIEFKGVHFHYPTRPDAKILKVYFLSFPFLSFPSSQLLMIFPFPSRVLTSNCNQDKHWPL